MNGRITTLALAAAIAAAPALARAQSATIAGQLGNFDAINNAGQDAHGFELQLNGLGQNDVYYEFSVNRYGAPTLAQNASGVAVRWASSYDAASGTYAQRTIPYAGGGTFGGTCYLWNAATYDTAGCEHYGVSLLANPVSVTARWLVADPNNAGQLIPVDPPMAIANPTYYILPPAPALPAPQLVAEVVAPEPPAAPELYGDAQWMKVFKREMDREVGLDELMSDNPNLVPEDAAHVETEWTLVQSEPATAVDGGQRKRKRNQGSLTATTRSVVRRYEMYGYSGAYDPATHQALCADLTCTAPSAGELGDFISAQNTAANVVVPSIRVNKVGSGQVTSADKLINCGTACTQLYNQNATVTLSASASSGSAFTGWSGACSGTASVCSVVVDQNLVVGATFARTFNLSIGRSNKGTVSSDDGSISCGTVNQKGISACSAKFTENSVVTLTATPPAGASFLSWGGACSGTSPVCQVTITKDTSVQANFSK